MPAAIEGPVIAAMGFPFLDQLRDSARPYACGLGIRWARGYYALLAANVEGLMDRQKISAICAKAPIILSWTAFVWVLGNVAGAVHTVHRGGDEGFGFHIFWLLIFVQAPFVLGYVLTADWRRWRGPAGIALQFAALVLAFSPVAFFKL